MDIAGYLEQKPCQEIAVSVLTDGIRTNYRFELPETRMGQGIVKMKKWIERKKRPAVAIKRFRGVGNPGYHMGDPKADNGLMFGGIESF